MMRSGGRDVYIAAVGLTKVDLTGKVFGSVFDLFQDAYQRALQESPIRSFDAVQVGIMDAEEFENRANIAAKIGDRLGLIGVPAVRSETASSTGAAAFHEACHKIASGDSDHVLVIAGERMKTVTTAEATAIMSKTVDPAERRFGFTMPSHTCHQQVCPHFHLHQPTACVSSRPFTSISAPAAAGCFARSTYRRPRLLRPTPA